MLPLKPRGKVPDLPDWPNKAATDGASIRAWWKASPDRNIGLATGRLFWVLDVDGPKGAESLAKLEAEHGALPATVESLTGSGGRHVFFTLPEGREVRNRTAVRPGLDVRGVGGQVVAPPSIHPNGNAYAWSPGREPGKIEIATAPDWLLALVAPTAELPAKPRPATRPPDAPQGTPVIERASLYLRECAPAIQGQGGHDALLWAARAMVVGFELSDADALALLWTEFNPRCVPPWVYGNPADAKDFERKVAEARRTPGTKPAGWLLDEYGLRSGDDALAAMGARLRDNLLASHARKLAPVDVTDIDPEPIDAGNVDDDPGPMPDRLLRIPGLISRVMDYCLETAPYPNVPLAFTGALALQSFLVGRKVRDPGDVRGNLYLCALAPSGSGKDWPRKLVKHVLTRAGFVGAFADRFASAAGIEDALLRTPARLYLTDEIDSLLQSLAKARDPAAEDMQAMLLTLYGESNTVHFCRDKAGPDSAGSIANPFLTLFGTAVPIHFYAAISERMLTNGLTSRLTVVDCNIPRYGKESRPIDAPDGLVEIARYWRAFAPGGNLAEINPIAVTVEHTAAARRILSELREATDQAYRDAPANEEATRAVLARVCEQGRKLALLYACSENHTAPRVDLQAARFGADFAMHQARRLLAMIQRYGATSEFEKDCRTLLDKLHAAPGRRLSRTQVIRSLRALPAKQVDERLSTLLQRGEIEIGEESSGGRPVTFYRATRRRR